MRGKRVSIMMKAGPVIRMLDLKAYIARKKERESLQQLAFRSLRRTCIRCHRPEKNCLCSFGKPFFTKTTFVLLMHPKEAKKEKNGTGRLAHLCLQNSFVKVGVDFTADQEIQEIIQDPNHFPFLLYPGTRSQEIQLFPFSSLKTKRPVLFALDGTWTAAKKMLKLNQDLQKLPRFFIQAPDLSQFLIKRQPHQNCLSTIESLYHYLVQAEKSGYEDLRSQHQCLMDILDKMVSYQMACTNSSARKGYRRNSNPPLKEQRIIQRRKSRNPFFE